MPGKKRNTKLKKFLIVLLSVILVFVIYVEIINRNSKGMTYRQKILKAVYPVWMWFGKTTGKNTGKKVNEKIQPPVSFYSLKAELNNGTALNFEELRNKKVLLVNTASDCGYTNQYEDLQQLYEQEKDQLVIIGFPANDFKQQEKGTDEEIASFCKANFGISFPLARKSIVIADPGQNPVFKWLTDPSHNGWNKNLPAWNFSKYLVNEKGMLTHYFEPGISPLSQEVQKAIQKH